MKTSVASIVTFGLVGVSLASAMPSSPKRSPRDEPQLDDHSTQVIDDDALGLGRLPEIVGDDHFAVLQKRATSVSRLLASCSSGRRAVGCMRRPQGSPGASVLRTPWRRVGRGALAGCAGGVCVGLRRCADSGCIGLLPDYRLPRSAPRSRSLRRRRRTSLPSLPSLPSRGAAPRPRPTIPSSPCADRRLPHLAAPRRPSPRALA